MMPLSQNLGWGSLCALKFVLDAFFASTTLVSANYMYLGICTVCTVEIRPHHKHGAKMCKFLPRKFRNVTVFFYNVFRATRYKTTSLPAALNQARRIDTLVAIVFISSA
jgi:hypothetical protein